MKKVEFEHEVTNGLTGKDRKVVKVVKLQANLAESLKDITDVIFKGNVNPTTYEFKRGRRGEDEPDRSLADFVNSLVISRVKADYEDPAEKKAKLQKQMERIQAALAELA